MTSKEQTNILLEKYTSHTLFSKGLWKGWCWLCVRGELEMERDCHILTPSSSDHSSSSSSFCWAAQLSVLRAQASYLQLELQLQLELTYWLPKLSVAPGYIIVWCPPASCGNTHLHRIQPCLQVKVIFRHPRLVAPVSALPLIYTGASLDWRLGRRLICNTSAFDFSGVCK